MDELGPGEPGKRKEVQPDLNWTDEAELAKVQEAKRRREEREPYNEPSARRRAREVGKQEARRMSWSNTSKVSTPPRGLSIEGESSPELMSEDEDSGQENEHAGFMDAQDAASPTYRIPPISPTVGRRQIRRLVEGRGGIKDGTWDGLPRFVPQELTEKDLREDSVRKARRRLKLTMRRRKAAHRRRQAATTSG